VENIQQKIVELESEIESSDGVFQAADREYDAAKQASESCRAELEGRREERSGVKAKYDEALKERLELKVSGKLNLFLSHSTSLTIGTGAAIIHHRAPQRYIKTNRGHPAENRGRKPETCKLGWGKQLAEAR
jgi:hypothetical protein